MISVIFWLLYRRNALAKNRLLLLPSFPPRATQAPLPGPLLLSEFETHELYIELDNYVWDIWPDFYRCVAALRAYATTAQAPAELLAHADMSTVHSYDHWLRVAAYSVYLAEPLHWADWALARRTLIWAAVVHDSCRVCDSRDTEHGRAAAAMAEGLFAWLPTSAWRDIAPGKRGAQAVCGAARDHTGAGLRSGTEPPPPLFTRIMLTADRLDRPRVPTCRSVLREHVWEFGPAATAGQAAAVPAISSKSRTMRLLRRVHVGLPAERGRSRSILTDESVDEAADCKCPCDETNVPVLLGFIERWNRDLVEEIMQEYEEKEENHYES